MWTSSASIQYWYNSHNELWAEINDFLCRSFLCYLSKWINLFPHFYLLKSIIIVSSKCILPGCVLSDHEVYYTPEKNSRCRSNKKTKTLFRMINFRKKKENIFLLSNWFSSINNIYIAIVNINLIYRRRCILYADLNVFYWCNLVIRTHITGTNK